MENFDKGYTQLPHSIGNILPLINLTGREHKVVDIIIRLTYGCNSRWAKIKPFDLRKVKIAPSHANEVIKPLLERKILEQNEKTKEYRLNEEYLTSEFTEMVSSELEDIKKLVGRQLSKKSSQISNKDIPNIGAKTLPKKESQHSQISNQNYLPIKEDLDTNTSGFVSPKDILNKTKYNDKKRIDFTSKIGYVGVDPDYYIPKEPRSYEMINAFRVLEGDNKESFPFYLWALKQGLPEEKFRQFREEILRTPKVKNKGALFVKKVKEYLENAD